MNRIIIAALCFALLAPQHAYAASLGALSVEVTNRSEPVLCAEKDNVTIAFRSPKVKSFRIEAAHPAYIVTLNRDSYDADWTACDLSGDPVFKGAPAHRRQTIYERADLWLVAHTFKSYWRPAKAIVKVGRKNFSGIHLLQLWVSRPNGGAEVLVFYPQDGYWRPRPLAPDGMKTTAYGSSFLIGPIEDGARPYANVKDVVFDPKNRAFKVNFAKGETAEVRLASVDQNRIALDVTFARPIKSSAFAMLRSMFVTSFNNDVARIAWREKAAKRWREDTIMNFKGGTATDVWTGRTTPSRHNTSSPDIVLKAFSKTSTPVLPKAIAP